METFYFWQMEKKRDSQSVEHQHLKHTCALSALTHTLKLTLPLIHIQKAQKTFADRNTFKKQTDHVCRLTVVKMS